MKPRLGLSGLARLAALPLIMLAGSASAEAPRTHTIVMANMRFAPAPDGIRAGDVIVWVNRDVVAHTATARNGSFDVNLPGRQSRRMTVRSAGSFAYYCRYHPAMRSVLRVAGR